MSNLANVASNLIEDVFSDPFFRTVLATPFFEDATRVLPATRNRFAPTGVTAERSTEDGTVSYLFDVPGVSKADITVKFNTETGELSVSADTETRKYNYRIAVAGDVDTEGEVTDKFKNGVLTLTFTTATPETKSPVRVLLPGLPKSEDTTE